MQGDIALIAAMFAALKADAALAVLIGQRIYDRVPSTQDGAPTVAYPYVSLGPTTGLTDDADCIPAEEITVQWDVWSSGTGEAYGSVECRKIAGHIKRVLHEAELSLSDGALATLTHEMTRILDDPQPHIHHGAVSFTGVVELN